MLSLQQKFSLQQKLSPQQIQYQKLLQLNTLALEQRIKTELEMNPILEEVPIEELELKQDDPDEVVETDSKDSDDEEVYESKDDEFEPDDFMDDERLDNDERINKSPGDDDDYIQPLARSRETMTERLINQLHMLALNEDELFFGEMIINSLDKDGYLKTDLSELYKEAVLFEHLELTERQAEQVLAEIQLLEPIGIGSRNLRECLLLQLKNKEFDQYYGYIAEQILTKHFDDFVNKRFEAIEKSLELSRQTLKSALAVIAKLNPKPGEGNIDSSESNQITPDFLIEKVETNYIITLNDRTMPSVTISQTYLEMLNSNKRKRNISNNDKETHKFLREKFESAKWFIASIQQRRDTLLKIMRAILEKQYDFFEYGPKALKPMIYKDIADEVQMDISTISRVVNGKYVQSPQGIHELKYFFSEGLSTDAGDEVSNKHIKILIEEIITSEPKNSPYSDDKIAKILTDRGIHIARRTVAKYREQLMLPVARLRKELL